MKTKYMVIRLDKSQHIESCDTVKSYAVKFSSNAVDMVFLPKSITSHKKVDIVRQGKIWSTHTLLEFPHWLYLKMSSENQNVIDMIISENELLVCRYCLKSITREKYMLSNVCEPCLEEEITKYNDR